MKNKIQSDRSRKSLRTALAILLAVSMVLGSTITDGWLPSYAEDTLSALGIRNRDSVSGRLLTAEGDDYTIHLDYKEDILPEHATLTAEELLPGTGAYGKLTAPDPEAETFRIFRVAVAADGAAIEPAEQATATVTWKNIPATSLNGRESVSLYDTHAVEKSENPEADDAEAVITDNGDGNTIITFSMKAPAIIKLPAASASTDVSAQDTEAAENQASQTTGAGTEADVQDAETADIRTPQANTPTTSTGTDETEAVTEQTTGAEIAALTGGDALLNTNGENAVPSLLSMEDTRNAPLLAASKSTEYTVEAGKKISITGTTHKKSHAWSSEDNGIATVTGSTNVGEVTGVSAGTVVITHKYNDGKNEEKFTVTVESPAVKASSLIVTPSEVSVREGESETVNISTDGCTVSSAVSSDESIATATLSGNVVAINGNQTGSTMITVTGTPLEGYSAPESKTITVTVVSGEEHASLTDEESTAQPSQTSDLKVSVKETGNWKKLSDYHVVVEDADQDYEGETDLLKAYHIYLADGSGKEVSADQLKHNGKNLNLQVTLTYENLPEWFASASQAGNIKHYKNKDDRTSLEITNIKFDATAKTIAFKIKSFSDFIVLGSTGQGSVQNQTELQAGDSNATVTLHKTASPVDGTRDEFDIRLAVDVTETTEMTQNLVGEFLRDATIYYSVNGNIPAKTSVGQIYTTAKQPDDTGKITLGDKGVELKKAEFGTGKEYTIKLVDSSNREIGSYTYTCNMNNVSFFILLGENSSTQERSFLIVSQKMQENTTSTAKLSDLVKASLYEAVYEYSTTKTGVSLTSVVDQMGSTIIYNNSAQATPGSVSPATASMQPGTSITWTIGKNANAVGTTSEVKSGNTTKRITEYKDYATLTYRIKVDTTASGFSYNNWLPANAGATLNYKVNDVGKTATFPVPQVKVIPYEYYAKLIYDANGGENPPAVESGGPIQSVKSDGENVNFTVSSIEPIRDGYTFEGWSESANGSVSWSAGDTYTFKATSSDSANPTERTLYAVWKQNIIPVTGLSLSGTASIVGAGAVAAGLLIALWAIRRRIWKKMS